MQSKLFVPSKDQVAGKLLKQYLIGRHPQASSLIGQVLRYETFSKMQGHCLETIFNNDDNILINAPTGSGKTHIFELAILQSYLHSTDKDSFKAVFVAPIKSLCSEVTSNWQLIFGPELRISELTSDFDFDKEEESDLIKNSNIIVMTPEKFSMLIRRAADVDLLISQLSIIVVDELHILDDPERGASLESSITRIKLLQKFKGRQKKIRIISASATFSNGSEICSWLEVPRLNFLIFSEDFRPVQINKYVFGYPPAKSPFLFDISLNYKVLEVITKFSFGKNSLIFCPTQKSAQKTAEEIVKLAQQRQFIKSEQHLQELTRSTTILSDQDLRHCLINGVGYHSAGLDHTSRKEVERLFRDNQLAVLCTTSTLAQGVNLPAYLVVIKGTKTYRGNDRGFEEYKYQDILQMMGRAGRPQFDTAGVCVLMTEYDMVDHYQQVKQFSIEINSHYLKNIRDDLGTEIALGTVRTIDCAIDFLKNSFFYVRLVQGKQKLDMKRLENKIKTKIPNEFIKAYIELQLQSLEGLELVSKEGDLYVASQALREISRQHVSIDSLEEILQKPVDILMTKESLFTTLCTSPEFSKLNSKLNERKELNDLNSLIEFPLKKSACTSDRKAWVLLQSYIKRLKIASWDLKLQAGEAAHIGCRLLKCYFKIYIDKKSAHCTFLCYNLLMSLKRRVIPGDSISSLRQVEGIDEKLAKTLVLQFAITSLIQLRYVDPAVLSDQKKQKAKLNLECVPKIDVVCQLSKKGKSHHLKASVKILERCSHFSHGLYHVFLCSRASVLCYRYLNLVTIKAQEKQIIDFVFSDFPTSLHVISDFYADLVYELQLAPQTDSTTIEWQICNKLKKTGTVFPAVGPTLSTKITEFFGKKDQSEAKAKRGLLTAFKKQDKERSTAAKTGGHQSTADKSGTSKRRSSSYDLPTADIDMDRELDALVAEYQDRQSKLAEAKQFSKRSQTIRLEAPSLAKREEPVAEGHQINAERQDKGRGRQPKKLSKKPMPEANSDLKNDLLAVLCRGRPDLKDQLESGGILVNLQSGKTMATSAAARPSSRFLFNL